MNGNHRIAKYWDEIQATTLDYEPRVQELHAFFSKYGVKKVLDAACGTGTLLLYLSRLGYECTGLDADHHMLAKAREKAEKENAPIQFLQGDMKHIKLDMKLEQKFHAVTCFQAFSFLASDKDVEQTLAGIKHTLVPGGLFIFEILGRDMDTGPAGPAIPDIPDTPIIPTTPDTPTIHATSLPPFIDIARETTDVKIVRINQLAMGAHSLEWQAIYFFNENNNENNGMTMEIAQVPLRVYTPGEIEKLVEASGFHIKASVSRDGGGIKQKNLMLYCGLNAE